MQSAQSDANVFLFGNQLTFNPAIANINMVVPNGKMEVPIIKLFFQRDSARKLTAAGEYLRKLGRPVQLYYNRTGPQTMTITLLMELQGVFVETLAQIFELESVPDYGGRISAIIMSRTDVREGGQPFFDRFQYQTRGCELKLGRVGTPQEEPDTVMVTLEADVACLV